MKLYEFQGKRIFRQYGLPVPQGTLVVTAEELTKLAPPLVLKAQVLVGGRGKAGGVKLCRNKEELSGCFSELMRKQIKGEVVRAILAEEKVDILQEYYLAITIKGGDATPVIIASAAGGVDIEQVARENPERITTVPFSPFFGPTEYHVRTVARGLGYSDYRELKEIVFKLYRIFRDLDATLVEINPLAQTPTGLLALDAKMVLDDKASFRQQQVLVQLRQEQSSLLGVAVEPALNDDTITYVPLSGTVGLISDGAGTGMLTLDLIKDAGGQAANFCEMGGITSPEVMYSALSKVLANAEVRSLLVVLIGGFNRMDEMAAGILKYREDHGLKVPIVVRMCGTMEEEGKEMMRQAGLTTYDDLLQAVQDAVQFAGGKE
ncbi:MAG: succinate--CoA ligase subunit beta [Firmicutes bacterium]|jgi:succinyl-CoA synthetase beta subunit|nr:succinate--CoA ligase subunit beta [Bacillota bacterium]